MNAISATEFKATCLDLLDQVASGATESVTITKRGRVVGVLRAPEPAATSLFGCMRGTVVMAAGFDVTAPVAPRIRCGVGHPASLTVLLLDTCALIWLVDGSLDDSPARPAVAAAAAAGQLTVSTTSAWEIGLLSRSGRIDFRPDAKTWFERAVAHPGLTLTPLTPAIAIDSSHLPGDLYGDPADRLIIATARHLPATVVTRDRRIIDYAAAGHIDVLIC